jgi:tRNA nucleotidyltransferase (CCA-adding enzyme)
VELTAAQPNLPELINLSPGTRAILDACERVDATALVVGGAVRDALLGVEGNDVDLEVTGDRERIIAALAPIGTVAVQGAHFPILAVHVAGENVDLSLALHEDPFARRDFTINAMGWNPVTGELVDQFGGQRDLAAGVLRHTSEHFADDPLRVLRGVQFAGRFGFRFAAETKGLCRSLVPRFAELPTERVWEEWRKLARRAIHWPEALQALDDSGWLQHFPELAQTRGVVQDPGWHAEGDVFTHLGLSARAAALASGDLGDGDREVVVLAALFHDLGKVTHTDASGPRITSYGHAEAGVAPARSLLHRIGAPAHVAARVLPIVREHMAHVSVKGRPSRPAVRRLTRRLAPASIRDWARVVDADCAGRGVSSKPSPSPVWLEVAATRLARSSG